MKHIKLTEQEAEFLHWLLEEVTMFHKMVFPREYENIDIDGICDQLE